MCQRGQGCEYKNKKHQMLWTDEIANIHTNIWVCDYENKSILLRYINFVQHAGFQGQIHHKEKTQTSKQQPYLGES